MPPVQRGDNAVSGTVSEPVHRIEQLESLLNDNAAKEEMDSSGKRYVLVHLAPQSDLAIAGFIVATLSAFFFWFPILGPLAAVSSLFLSLSGLLVATRRRAKKTGRIYALAGLGISIAAIIFETVFPILTYTLSLLPAFLIF